MLYSFLCHVKGLCMSYASATPSYITVLDYALTENKVGHSKQFFIQKISQTPQNVSQFSSSVFMCLLL